MKNTSGNIEALFFKLFLNQRLFIQANLIKFTAITFHVIALYLISHSKIKIFHVHRIVHGEQFFIRLLEEILTVCNVLNWTAQSTAT